MLKKVTLLSALVIAASSMQAFASHASFEIVEAVGGVPSDFQICKSALRTYVMVERYVGGSCPADVSPEDLLNAVKYLGVETYDFVREKASQEEVDNLRTRLASAHREGDPDVSSAVSRVVFAREYYAKEHIHKRARVPHCLSFVHRTLQVFLNNSTDENLIPGEGIMGKRYFAENDLLDYRFAVPQRQIHQVVRL